MKQTFKNEIINESYIEVLHKSGLKILVCEKPEYTSSYVLFGTRYGSIDTKFKTAHDDSFVTVPEGIAHFLEHKLFESEDGDAFSRFAKTGAAANAYTAFDRTCYLFSCSNNFEDSFRILLDFVQKPYFTEETVQKEQGIIGQEIKMYEDSAPWRVFFNLLTAIYVNHPVRIDIAGTVESIAQIDASLLHRCYNTFYNLNNMFLCVAGNVKADEIISIADELIKDMPPIEIERGEANEPLEVAQKRYERKLEVSMPLFAIGYKEKCEVPQKTVKQQVETELLLEILAGNSSPLYKKLFDEGLINENFSSEYFTGHNYAAVIFSGDSTDYDKVYGYINEEISRLKNEGIDEAAFQRAKKKHYGRAIMRYNSVKSVADQLVASAFLNVGVFDDLEAYKTVTSSDIKNRLGEQLNAEYSAISLVLPRE